VNNPPAPAWYLAWMNHHLLTFGIKTHDAVQAFTNWYGMFAAFGYTEAELREATASVINSGPPPVRIGDHYLAIKKAIGAARNTRQREELDSDTHPDLGRCVDCGDTGIVSVPHPDFADPQGWRPIKHNAAGDPVYCRMGVTCRCNRGHQIHQAQLSRVVEKKLKAASMTLEEYTDTKNYTWRQQIADEYARRKHNLAVESSLTMPNLMKLLDEQMKPRREE